jgi:hypothetical protein
VGARVRPVARAVPGRARRRAPAALGPGVRARAPRAGRAQERRAVGRPRRARGLRAGAPLCLRLVLGPSAAGAGARREGAGDGRRAGGRPDHRRHRAAEAAGHALGGRGASVRGRRRQDDELPDARLADAGAGRGAGRPRAAAVPPGGVDGGSGALPGGRRAGGPARVSHEAGDRARGTRPRHRGGRDLQVRARGRGLRHQRHVPPGALGAGAHLGRRHPAHPEGLSARRDDVHAGTRCRADRAAIRCPRS